MTVVARRAVVLILAIIIAVGVGDLVNRLRSGDLPTSTPPASPSALASASLSPSQTASATSTTAMVTYCGTVARYAADGAHMLLTLTDGSTTAQFNLQYQFAQRPPPTDIGDRFARGETQLLRVTGRGTEPDGGSGGATTLRDFLVERVTSCS